MFGNSLGGMNGINTPLTPVSSIKIKDESNKENSFLESRYSYSPHQSRFVNGARMY
jgi:hypothetical protein